MHSDSRLGILVHKAGMTMATIGIGTAVHRIHEARSRVRPGPWTVIPLLALVVYLGLAGYANNFLPLRLVTGTSMNPTLAAGDVVLVRTVPATDIQVGDVIAYKRPDGLPGTDAPVVLHRVVDVRIEGDGLAFITRGDNSDTDPFPVRTSMIEGEMTGRIPMMGRPIAFLISERGILFLSIATLLGLLYIPAMFIFYLVVIRQSPWTSGGP